jgi:two-component system invasion response regulator UvrY
MTHTIRLMLVDDHAIVREGYRRLFEKHRGLTIAAEAADGVEAYRQYKQCTPDVVVLDLSMPGKGGIEVIRHLRQWDPHARILVFTMHLNAAYAIQAFQAGAKGYITKSSAPELLVEGVRQVFAGQPAISPDVSRELALARVSDEATALDTLAPREFEILRMLVEAKSTQEIARTLNISVKTVANYHYAIKSKLGVSSDIELLHYAMRVKLVDYGGG